jgi:hypothetical protein
MRVDLPVGWSGRIVLGASGRPVLHAASYPLAGGNDNDSGEIARESLGTANAIYLNMRDLGSGDSSAAFPLTFVASDFEPSPPREGIQTHASRDVAVSGRLYRITLASGGADPPAAWLLNEANRVLLALNLEPYVPVPVPRLPADAKRIEGHGMSMQLPSDWDGHVGRGELDARSRELRLRLLEHAAEPGGEFVTGRVPILLTPAEFVPAHGGSASITGRSFVDHGREFVLWVDANTFPPSTEAVEEANEALATLTVLSGDFYPGSVEPATFTAANGWHTGTSGSTDAKPDGQQTFTWASTISYLDTPFQFPPHSTLDALPPDGIAIDVQLYGPDERARPAAFPFRMAQAGAPGSFEGVGPRTPLYGLGGRVPGQRYSAHVSVFFGRPHPTHDQLAAADAELARLTLPDWSATD